MRRSAACLVFVVGILAACGRTTSSPPIPSTPTVAVPVPSSTEPATTATSPTPSPVEQSRPTPPGLLRLTNDPALDSYPAWSWDGHRIAMSSDRTGVYEIYAMDPDGGNLVRLTEEEGTVLKDDPTWSPDGKEIAFALHSDLTRIYAFDVAQAALEPFDPFESTAEGFPEQLGDPYADAFNPSWSPDGRRMALTMFDSNMVLQVFTLDLRSGELVQLSDGPADAYGPSWSADGRWMAYTAEDGGNAEIYMIAADGSGLKRLTDDPARDNSPSWSPDGRFIIFHSTRDVGSDLYVLRVDGGEVIRLDTGGPENSSPSWSPDGRYIAFVSDRDGNAEIYRINAPVLAP